jgi:hypothetical protein
MGQCDMGMLNAAQRFLGVGWIIRGDLRER